MIPETMRAFVLHGHGGLDQLHYHEDWPTPHPGPGEVLIRVGACGLNNTDINTRSGWYSDTVTDGITVEGGASGFTDIKPEQGSWGGQSIRFPRIQGADAAGEIVAVGTGVDEARMGERVITDGWILPAGDWFDARKVSYFGSECDGGYAEYATIPSINAIRVQSALTDAELATFPCSLSTAENLIARTGLRPGEVVAIAGASGGVGSYAIQLCRLRGVRVIAIANPAKTDALLDLGASAVVDRNSPDLEGEIRAAAAGPLQVALDVVGAGQTPALLKALAHGGRYSSSGAIAGPMIDFDLRWLIYKDLQMTGSTLVPPGTMERMARLIDEGKLRPMLAKTFPLAGLREAQTAFMSKQHTGNIVVTCKD